MPSDAAAVSPALKGSLAQTALTGVIMSLVGFGSSFAVVVNGVAAMGASPAEQASGLMVICFAMGALSFVLSIALRMPISIAWSTPGAAVLATTGAIAGGFPAALGAFVIAGGLIVLAGLWRPLGRLASAIPAPIASAMLAGVLLKLCVAPFTALALEPLPALAVLATFLVVSRFARLYAAIAAVAVALVLTVALEPAGGPGLAAFAPPVPVFIMPVFTWDAVAGVALPLFIVTMASQNVTGLAVLSSFGYRPPAGRLFAVTGAASVAIAFFGAITVNLAAITVAISAGPDAHPDPARRWIAGATSGVAYLVIGLLAGGAVTAMTAAPPVLIQAAAGLALVGAFGASVVAGFQDEADRPAALVTFLLSASGVAFGGVGSAFWGLLAGLCTLALYGRLRRG